MALVLASNIEESQPDENSVTGVSPKVVGKRGEKLPAALKDREDEFLREGVLVDESLLAHDEEPEMHRSTSLTELEYLSARRTLSDEDLENEDQANADAEASPSITRPARAVNTTAAAGIKAVGPEAAAAKGKPSQSSSDQTPNAQDKK